MRRQKKVRSNTEETPLLEKLSFRDILSLSLLMPIFKWILYHIDIASDLWQAWEFYTNCHYIYFASNIGIIISSFLVTSIYAKFYLGLRWLDSIRYMVRYE